MRIILEYGIHVAMFLIQVSAYLNMEPPPLCRPNRRSKIK